jgi:hypothetical protein
MAQGEFFWSPIKWSTRQAESPVDYSETKPSMPDLRMEDRMF